MAFKPDITILGTIVFDIFVLNFEKFPSRGQAVKTDEIIYSIGGCGANPAILLSKLGVNVSLIGSVGFDFWASFILSVFKAYNVDTSFIKLSLNYPSAVSILFLNKSGERSYIHRTGASNELDIQHKELRQIYKSKIFHIGGANLLPSIDGKPMAQILKKVKSKKVITSVDLAWDVDGLWMEKLKYSLPYIDILMGNEDEIKTLTKSNNIKSSVKILHNAGVKTVVVKRGKKGSFVSQNFDQFDVPPFKVKVKDTTGAGDAFVGGFLYGFLNGMNIYECARIGNYFGALVTTNIGAITALLDYEEFDIQQILESNTIDL